MLVGKHTRATDPRQSARREINFRYDRILSDRDGSFDAGLFKRDSYAFTFAAAFFSA